MSASSFHSGDGRPPAAPLFSLPPSYDREGWAQWGNRFSYVVRPDLAVRVKDEVLSKLRVYRGGGTPQEEDNLFAEHTWLVGKARDREVDRSIPVNLWNDHLAPATAQAELRLARFIHKGAPHYNVGLCHFLNGNFQQAYIYFNQGAEEEWRTRGLQPKNLLGGQHLVSRMILIQPLVADLLPQWAAEYKAVTGCGLDEPELLALIDWLFQREVDGIQFLIALHELRSLLNAAENEATRLARLNAVRSLHIAIESALRFHAVGNTEFHNRMEIAMQAHPDASSGFTGLHDWFTSNPPDPVHVTPAERKTHVGVNLVLVEGLNRFAAAATWQHRAGIIAYLSVKIRNSAIHQNDDKANLFTQRALAYRVCGWALASCRSVRHSVESTL